MDRSTVIRDRLVSHCRDKLNIYCSEIKADDWRALPLALQYRFGWMPPADLAALDIEDNLIAIIAPEMIAAITAHLSDEVLDTYLTVVELFFDAHVARQGEPVEEIDEAVQANLWAVAPDVLKLRLEIEARALDEGIVAICH